jgi:hypothetical protein
VIAVALSLLYLTVTGALGVALLWRAARRVFGPLELVAYGAPLGIALGSVAVLLLALAIGLSALTVAVAGGASLLLSAVLWPARRRWRGLPAGIRAQTRGWSPRHLLHLVRCRIGLFPAAVLGGLTLLWVSFYPGMTFERDGGLWASQVHVWSDLSVHLGQVTAFAYGDNFPPHNPFYAGEPFAYHYLISVTTAALVALGLEPLTAIKLHDLLLATLVTLAAFAFARRLTGSADAAALAVLLFFLGSGLGWLLTAAEINRSHDIVGTLLDRAWSYEQATAAGIRWEPVFLVAIAPTRGTLYGLALGILALATLFQAVRRREPRLFVLAGAAAGLLPLAHAGTLLALGMIAAVLFLLFPSRSWIAFFAVWFALALPQLYLQGGLSGGTNRIQRDFGWMADDENAVWFWLTNLGLFIPLLLLALVDRTSLAPPARRFLWAFMPIFVVANVVSLSPIGPWDNLKVLIYWFLAVCILVAALLVRTWQEQRAALVRALLLGCVASLLLSGLLMHLHVARGGNAYMVFSPAEVELARQVRERTAPDAVVLSGLQHNPVVTALAGRPTLIFFTPYLRSWGIDPTERERDVRAIYAFTPEAPELLRQYDVSYVQIGPSERRSFNANVEAFRDRFPVIASTEGYEVFDVRGPIAAVDAQPAPASPAGAAYPARSEGECITPLSGGPSYYLQDGRRRLIPNDETRRALGCEVVWPWGDQEVERIPAGDPLPPR